MFVDLTRSLEGFAVMERVRAVDGGWEAFRVRAYEPGPGRWAEYALDLGRAFARSHLIGTGTVPDTERTTSCDH